MALEIIRNNNQPLSQPCLQGLEIIKNFHQSVELNLKIIQNPPCVATKLMSDTDKISTGSSLVTALIGRKNFREISELKSVLSQISTTKIFQKF